MPPGPQVGQLESQLKAKKDDATKVATDLVAAQGRLSELAAESERAKESVAMSEKSLGLALESYTHAGLLLNPLNHPRVKALIGGGGAPSKK